MANKKKNIQEETSKEEVQKNYVKNYIMLFILFGCCIFLTLYFCKWYEVYEEYEKETPVIRDSLSEITSEDLDHYVIDTPSIIIYMCTANDDECRSFEKDFKKYINKNDITDEVTYLNLTGVDKDQFVKDFNEKYNFKIKLNGHYPTFVAFQDGKITSILQGKKDKKITISKVRSFLELNLLEEEEEETELEQNEIDDVESEEEA